MVTVLVLTMLLPAISSPLDREWGTPIGIVPVGDLLVLAVAAFVAAMLARSGFRRWAAGLAVLIWAIRLAALLVVAPAVRGIDSEDVFRGHLLSLPLGVLIAWLAAWAGERYGQVRIRERAARPSRPRWR